jgi:hypothetical protein
MNAASEPSGAVCRSWFAGRTPQVAAGRGEQPALHSYKYHAARGLLFGAGRKLQSEEGFTFSGGV